MHLFSNLILKSMYFKCGKSMKFKQALKKHMKTHEPDYKNETFSCEPCNITYKAKFNLRRHIRVFHEGIKPYPCEVCKQAFSNTTVSLYLFKLKTIAQFP